MKNTLYSLLFLLTIGFNTLAYSQNENLNIDFLHNYYIQKDENLIEKTIQLFNTPELQEKNVNHIIIGFYGALFNKDKKIKKQFKERYTELTNEDIRTTFELVFKSKFKEILASITPTPTLNDVYWSAFFSTGNNQYLDEIFANCTYVINQRDLNKYLIGASAQWSMCSNAKEHERVKLYLEMNQTNPDLARYLLEIEPDVLKNGTIDFIKDGRIKGYWE